MMGPWEKSLQLNVETLVLVAVWETPFIFQGFIKIAALHQDNMAGFFFRCQSKHQKQHDILDHDFSSDDYVFTHLYHEAGFILVEADVLDPVKEYALDMLKYALHITLREMISSRKLHFTMIDDVAMQVIIDKIKPILNKEKEEVSLPEEDHIGFAVAMDFCPQEELGHLAALALLNNLESAEPLH